MRSGAHLRRSAPWGPHGGPHAPWGAVWPGPELHAIFFAIWAGSSCEEILSQFGLIWSQFGSQKNCENFLSSISLRPFRDLPPPLVLELALAPRRPRKACPHRSEMRGTRRADMCELVRFQAAHKLRLAGHDELCLAVMTAHLHPSAIHNPGGLPRCVPCPCPVRTPHVLCACRSALIVAGPTRLPAHARPKARRL